MTEVQCVVDSIRVAAACPDELTLILRNKDVDSYLPIFIGQQQGKTLANELHGRPDSKKELDTFLANHNATDSDISCATIYLKDTTFFAKVLLSRHHTPYEVSCPIGLALALAVRANASILVDEAPFDRAGVRIFDTPYETH
jgi:bifunctional DNase/RNase